MGRYVRLDIPDIAVQVTDLIVRCSILARPIPVIDNVVLDGKRDAVLRLDHLREALLPIRARTDLYRTDRLFRWSHGVYTDIKRC